MLAHLKYKTLRRIFNSRCIGIAERFRKENVGNWQERIQYRMFELHNEVAAKAGSFRSIFLRRCNEAENKLPKTESRNTDTRLSASTQVNQEWLTEFHTRQMTKL